MVEKCESSRTESGRLQMRMLAKCNGVLHELWTEIYSEVALLQSNKAKFRYRIIKIIELNSFFIDKSYLRNFEREF